MAQFSQGFLSSLGRPEMSQSLFGLGAAIGGVPGQMKQRQKEQAFNQLMQQVQAAQGSGDFASMKALSQQMAQTNPQQAAQIMQAAIAGEEKQKRIQAGSGMFSGTPEEARASAKQSAALGDFASAQQALARAEKLEQQGKQVGRARTSAQMLMSEIQGIMKTPDISEANKEKALGLLREAAVAGEDSDLLKPRVDELKQSLLPVKTGSRAAPKKVTLFDKKSGRNQDWAFWRKNDGTIEKELLGFSEVEEEEEDPVDLGLDTKWGSDLLTEARTKAQEAETNAANYNQLATEARDRAFYERGFLGKTLSATEEALGIAGAATTHRRRINEIRMSGALALLPKGPASDRDVALALDASIDPNNLENEEAESYLRGMAKIAEAEEEYYSRKTQFIQYTKDPNAVGFENWVAKTGAEKEVDYWRNQSGGVLDEVLNKIETANKEQDPIIRKANLQALEATFPDMIESLYKLNSANDQWDSMVSKNPGLGGML